MNKNSNGMDKKIDDILEGFHLGKYDLLEVRKQLLILFDVRYRRELLIALLREQDLEYIQQQDCPELLAEDIIKAIYSI